MIATSGVFAHLTSYISMTVVLIRFFSSNWIVSALRGYISMNIHFFFCFCCRILVRCLAVAALPSSSSLSGICWCKNHMNIMNLILCSSRNDSQDQVWDGKHMVITPLFIEGLHYYCMYYKMVWACEWESLFNSNIAISSWWPKPVVGLIGIVLAAAHVSPEHWADIKWDSQLHGQLKQLQDSHL